MNQQQISNEFWMAERESNRNAVQSECVIEDRKRQQLTAGRDDIDTTVEDQPRRYEDSQKLRPLFGGWAP